MSNPWLQKLVLNLVCPSLTMWLWSPRYVPLPGLSQTMPESPHYPASIQPPLLITEKLDGSGFMSESLQCLMHLLIFHIQYLVWVSCFKKHIDKFERTTRWRGIREPSLMQEKSAKLRTWAREEKTRRAKTAIIDAPTWEEGRTKTDETELLCSVQHKDKPFLHQLCYIKVVQTVLENGTCLFI